MFFTFIAYFSHQQRAKIFIFPLYIRKRNKFVKFCTLQYILIYRKKYFSIGFQYSLYGTVQNISLNSTENYVKFFCLLKDTSTYLPFIMKFIVIYSSNRIHVKESKYFPIPSVLFSYS